VGHDAKQLLRFSNFKCEGAVTQVTVSVERDLWREPGITVLAAVAGTEASGGGFQLKLKDRRRAQ
jgi:hypothetical protein